MKKHDNEISRDPMAADDAEDTVAKLISLAGPRAEIAADLQSRVHDKVRLEWLRATRRKQLKRWAVPLAVAASVLLAVAINLPSPTVSLPKVGTVTYVAGDDASNGTGFSVGDAVLMNDVIETGNSAGLSLALVDDISLRIDSHTAIRIDSADEITVLRGQIYADSGERIYRDRHITVHTAGGSATDVGTQFSVAYESGQLNVSVREGRVDIASDQQTFTAEAGDSLTIQPGNEIVREKVTPYDASWEWASALAPGFVGQNESLLDFLKWAARETGKELIFANDELRMAAMGTTVYGAVRDFRPMDAIATVLPTTAFKYRVDERSITILN
jgi:ferric-dicitrate binding protein FerR (iron transport regulator)